MTEASDASWMKRALDAAREGLGSTAPNPSVGAVLVQERRVIGVGTTQPVGGPHAEVVAIRAALKAGENTTGSTLYVTLEPCRHFGRTPPCTDAIVAAGIGRVVVGTEDPFPEMQGKSFEILRAAGIDVTVGVDRSACERMILGFSRAVKEGFPEVTCKAAISLDGHIATAAGESKWITGELARAHGRALRSEHDAILVGIGTLLADNPRLTARGEGPEPVPVILDSQLRIPSDAAVFSHPRRPILVCAEFAPERELPADILRVPGERVDIDDALRALVSRGLHRVLVEGGGQVHRSLLERDRVDTLALYVAGIVVPGGRPWVSGEPLAQLGDARRWGRPEILPLGDDVLLQYTKLSAKEA